MRFLMFIYVLITLPSFADDISYFEDKSTLAIISDIENKSEGWLEYNKVHSSFGWSESNYWLKITLNNSHVTAEKKFINFTYPMLDTIKQYEEKNDVYVEVAERGNLVVDEKTSRVLPNLLFKVDVASNKSKTIYFKIESQTPMNLDLAVMDEEEFSSYNIERIGTTAFYVGAILIILLYNLIIYSFIRVYTFLAYVMFHTIFLFLVLVLNGYFYEFVWYDVPNIGKYILPLLIAAATVFQVHFFKLFLDIQRYGTKLNVLVNAILLYDIFAFVSALFLPYTLALQVATIGSFLSTIIPFLIAQYLIFKYQVHTAKYYTLAWLFLMIGIVIEHLKNLGIVETTLFSRNAMQLGAIIEVVLISIGLADRFNNLLKSNEKLSALVSIDMLTGVYNRHHFFEVAQKMLRIIHIKKEDYALLMLDLDHFKKINDTYGHDAGDRVLRSFAQHVRQGLRENDIFARIGGEEFTLLIKASKEESIAFANRLREMVKKIELFSDEDEKIAMSVSIGVVGFNDAKENLEKLLKYADKALYSAKEQGRDRVEYITKA